MRHRKKTNKLSRNLGQRKSLLKSLVRSLLLHESITTTHVRAKQAQRTAERLINWAREDTLHNRRLCFDFLQDHALVKKLFSNIGPRFKEIKGGYTRILKINKFRRGDGSSLSLLELIVKEKKPEVSKKPKGREKKPPVEHPPKEIPPKREKKPSGGFRASIRKIFKKERDSL